MTPSFAHRRLDGVHLLYDADRFGEARPDQFDPAHWRTLGAVTGTARGRDEATFFRHRDREWLLKSYRRGGVLGKLVERRYLNLGVRQSRAWREFVLLSEMASRGLPCPAPGAAMIHSHGPTLEASLITERIAGASDLASLLSKKPLENATWQRIGATIARFHRAGVDHADLNLRNILLDGGGAPWLIDFDKGRLREPSPRWQSSNLARLRRSLEKERGLVPDLHWHATDWDALLAGYRMPET